MSWRAWKPGRTVPPRLRADRVEAAELDEEAADDAEAIGEAQAQADAEAPVSEPGRCSRAAAGADESRVIPRQQSDDRAGLGDLRPHRRSSLRSRGSATTRTCRKPRRASGSPRSASF